MVFHSCCWEISNWQCVNKLASDINAERAKELEAWNEKMKDTEEMVKLVELQKKKKSSMSKLNAKAEPDENWTENKDLAWWQIYKTILVAHTYV